ncbi:hypothetical protein HD554DRAFT_2170686 [Boletus coccyginus]|nr:hypothetical protein HD554DRAFT_2170686 [Boletus coccyginus]
MSLTSFEDILMLSKALSADPAKLDTIKEVTKLKIQLDGMSWSVPDDQDDLAEDQEMWCVRWQKLLNQVHTSFQHVKEHGMDTALEADLLTQMQGANSLSCQWLGAAAVLAWAAKAAGLGEQEQTPVAEQAVGSATPSPVQESADEPPTTESPSKEHESMSNVGQKQKRVSSWMVVDEEEDNGDDIIKVMALKPSKVQTGSKTVTHTPPCDSCQRGGRTCTRILGHTCDLYIRLKTKCGKSKGKVGKAKKDMALIAGPKAKGKEKVQPRPVHNNAHMVIPVCKAPVALSSQVEADLPDFLGFSPSPEPNSDHEDDDVTPHKKAKLADLAQDVAVETMKLALLTMQMKMHGMLSFLTKLQARAKVAKTYISSQQLEIEEMEVLLEEL